ncbi:hypothetical protein [Fredinandcohnia sp. 179-A 10B2 NHS]|uniref:hypothetical protein n=1 Tax=Fredinandcohnia sp. 179-A 10B2 NHS TaxID=3235176 RepID=UPI0039A35561
MKEFYHECLLNEEATLAHYIYHLLSERKVSLQDDLSQLDLNKADHQKVAEMIETNLLGFHRVNVYSLKTNFNDFVFIFARNHQEATQYFAKMFLQTPKNCYEYPLDFEFVRGNELVTFRDMKKEHESYPAVAGYYRKM